MKRYIAKLSLTFILLLQQTPSCFSQTISTIAGTGSSLSSGDGGPASLAGLPNPGGGDFDKNGNFYFVDLLAHRVKKITPSGVIYTVAGNGMGGFAGDGGPAISAKLNRPVAVRVDTAGNLFIADEQNERIRRVDALTGVISTYAGNGTGAFGGDGGPATLASFWGIQDICFDKHYNLYVADAFNYRIRKINPSGIISTVAGNGIPGYSGEGVEADTASIGLVVGICSDSADNLFLASNTICRVLKITTSGLMYTAAGNGDCTYTGDGIPAVSARIGPLRVFADNFHNLFIADKANNRVYKVDGAGILYNIAGNGTAGDAGDGGSATSASLYGPVGVTLDDCGNLYVPTAGNSVPGSGRRIRKITFNPPTTSTISITGIAASPLSTTVTINATVVGTGGSYSIRWFNKGVQFATTTVPIVTYTKTQDVDSITARLVPTIMYCYDSSVSNVHVVTKATGGVAEQGVAAVSVYPNPGGDVLYVSGGDIAEVVDLVGRVVASGKDKINVSGLASGVYVVRVYGVSGWVSVVRWVKE